MTQLQMQQELASALPTRERVVALFHDTYGSAPSVLASAPGRVNLIGEHLDYNGGPVLPFAIDRRTWIAAGQGDEFTMVSGDAGGNTVVRSEGPARGHWSDYVMGVVHELRRAGGAPAGARLAVVSEVEPGAGLSSSAALTVATAAALGRLAGRGPGPEALADAAFHAEYDYVGVRCGRMDQTIVTHATDGTALYFDTATGRYHHVPFPHDVWVIPTGVEHTLADGGYNARRAECEEALRRCRERWPELPSLAALEPSLLAEALPILPPPLDRRVRHVVTEVARTREAVQVLERGDLSALGRLLVAGHQSLRVDYECSVPEADLIVEAAAGAGAYGARLTGAGWGGSVIVLTPEERGAEIVGAAGQAFATAYGRTPGAWRTRPSPGVRVERLA